MAKNIHPDSTTGRAAHIRAALKAKGWTSRDVSVRADYFSLGSAIRVVIKNPAVPLATVKTLAESHERIDRDQWGDILGGGNRYVDVSYSTAAVEILARRHIEALESAEARLRAADSPNALIPIGDTGYFLGNTNGLGYNGVSLWSNTSHVQSANTINYLASVLAIQLQQEGR